MQDVWTVGISAFCILNVSNTHITFCNVVVVHKMASGKLVFRVPLLCTMAMLPQQHAFLAHLKYKMRKLKVWPVQKTVQKTTKICIGFVAVLCYSSLETVSEGAGYPLIDNKKNQ